MMCSYQRSYELTEQNNTDSIAIIIAYSDIDVFMPYIGSVRQDVAKTALAKKKHMRSIRIRKEPWRKAEKTVAAD